MAIRTNNKLVEAVLGDNYNGTTNLTPFIDAANAIVNRVATCATDKGETLTATELELIERWLAAHLYAQMDPTYASKSTAGASASFHGQTAMGFDSTLYGQTATRLDFSGCLENLDKTQVVTAAWLGKAPSDQTDYEDRD